MNWRRNVVNCGEMSELEKSHELEEEGRDLEEKVRELEEKGREL